MSTSRQPLPPPSPSPPLPPLSSWSSHGIPSSCFYSGDFMLGAGMLIIQPETGRVVVIHHPPSGEWFLPKGRKDIGESLEQAAVREAHEEVRPFSPCSYPWRELSYLFGDGLPRRATPILSGAPSAGAGRIAAPPQLPAHDRAILYRHFHQPCASRKGFPASLHGERVPPVLLARLYSCRRRVSLPMRCRE